MEGMARVKTEETVTAWQTVETASYLSYWSSGDMVREAQGDPGAHVGSVRTALIKLNEFEVQTESHRASEKKPLGESRPF